MEQWSGAQRAFAVKAFPKTTTVSKPLDVYFAFTLIFRFMILYRLLMTLKHGYVILNKLVLLSKRSLRVE
jgi:hypothetical protein